MNRPLNGYNCGQSFPNSRAEIRDNLGFYPEYCCATVAEFHQWSKQYRAIHAEQRPQVHETERDPIPSSDNPIHFAAQ